MTGMVTMALFFLESIVIALFLSLNKVTNAHITTLQAELYTTIDVPCGCIVCPGTTSRVRWYLSSNPDVFENSGSAVAWWAVGQTGSTEGFEINADFSMKINYLTPHHNGQLFRCLVAPLDGSADCVHDVKFDIYAKPETPPVIDFIRQPGDTGGFNVTCSISNVFPKTFPILGSEDGTVAKGFLLNVDGTFNTNVTNYFSTVDGDTTIECLYSIRKFKSKSSLRIVDCGDISGQHEGEDCVKNNGTGWFFLKASNRDSQRADEMDRQEGAISLEGEDITRTKPNESGSGKSGNIMVSRNLIRERIYFSIHTTIMILLVVYLASEVQNN